MTGLCARAVEPPDPTDTATDGQSYARRHAHELEGDVGRAGVAHSTSVGQVKGALDRPREGLGGPEGGPNPPRGLLPVDLTVDVPLF